MGSTKPSARHCGGATPPSSIDSSSEALTAEDAVGGRSVSLNVIPNQPHAPRKSKMGWKRTLVLVGVHVVFAIHILQWLNSGLRTGNARTLSPIEPSESMYTLELGTLNAGFIFFALALLSTLIFGRFFCGWGCHIVALQDACGWFMKKLGVHPKPFRTRLLLLMPLVLALYMFVWPTFYRELLAPAITGLLGHQALENFAAFISESPLPRPHIEPELFVEDFWRTFAAWYVGIPFLLICGFATVYFLGAKGFCTYGCPYGGFFAPLDKYSVGKILVNDNCEQCGHCTAVCTSNVRVHEEVRDYGMVVDVGCMKCLDCVSVCPKDALRFGFGKPAVLAKPRDAAAAARRSKKDVPGVKRVSVHYDMTRGEEVFFGILFVWLTFACFRGMLEEWGPLLMAAGIGSIATFTTWKLWRLVRDQNVRLAHAQLKYQGRLRPAGLLFVPLAIGLLCLGLWSGVVRANRWWGSWLDYHVRTPAEVVFRPGYTPTPEDKATAERALAFFHRGDSVHHGGWGWRLSVEQLSRVAWLSAVAGDLDGMIAAQERLVAIQQELVGKSRVLSGHAVANRELSQGVARLADFVAFKAAKEGRDGSARAGEVLATYAKEDVGLGTLWLSRARHSAQLGRTDEALGFIETALRVDDAGPAQRNATSAEAAAVLRQHLGNADRALAVLEAVLAKEKSGAVLHALAMELAARGQAADARAKLEEWTALTPREPAAWRALAEFEASQRRFEFAAAAARSGLEKRPRASELHVALGNALLETGKESEAIRSFERATELDKLQIGAWIGIAQAQLARRPADAERTMREALRHLPGSGQVRAALIDVLAANNKREEALQQAKRGGEIDPWTPFWPTREAVLLRQLGRESEAKAAEERARARERLLGVAGGPAGG